MAESYNPSINRGLAYSLFARRYWGNLCWFLFLRYWDISVHEVSSTCPMCSDRSFRLRAEGLSHSEIFGSKRVWQLAEAYRSLQRPSSELCAKASTIRNLFIYFLHLQEWVKFSKTKSFVYSVFNLLQILNHFYIADLSRVGVRPKATNENRKAFFKGT